MNFEYTEDRRMLMDSLNRFISEQYSADVRNQIAYGAQGHSPKLYAQLAELGIIGALFPEEVGGFAGAGFDISVVFECLGRGIVPEPLLGALLVGRALILAGSDTQKEQLQSLMDGTVIAALAHDEPGAHYELCHVTTTAKREGPNWMLSGVKGLVSFGEKADCLLVSARTSG
jgi:alkylation response protein AidB-like acyl-CoA dehydrogenase